MEILDHAYENHEASTLTKTMKKHLKETAVLGRFLSIIGFIILAFILFTALVAMLPESVFSNILRGAYINVSGGGAFGVFLLVYGFVWFFPVWYMYKFSTNTLKNLPLMNLKGIEEALENLKSLFKFYGVFAGIILGLYAFIILVSVVNNLIK